MKRLRSLRCRLAGHLPPRWFEGYFRGTFVRVEGCPRCGIITGRREVGSRQARRAARRAMRA